MATRVTKLDKARAQIVLDHPFFASILLKRKLVNDPQTQTLAVDARGTIYYNEKFVESLTVPQLVWGLCHEIGHVIGQHATRKKTREHKKWNYAGDAWINDMLTDAKVGDPIPNTVNMPGSKDKTTETIYDELPDDPNGDGKGHDNGLGDDIKYEDLTDDQVKEIEAQAKVEIAQAAQAAKARGKLPGILAQFVADFINVKTPWYDILENKMTAFVKQDSTWLRPNRRFINQGLYMPSIDRVPMMGEVVIQVDVSGSISRQELAYYNGHLSRIVLQCNPTKVHVIYTDTEVQRYVEFNQGEEIALEFYSGGGTHMPAGFDFIAEKGIEPNVFVCLTDGYTDFGIEPGYPVVWCISSNVISPVGETIHFEMEQ
jgi:predicted metal-dependent peptidase